MILRNHHSGIDTKLKTTQLITMAKRERQSNIGICRVCKTIAAVCGLDISKAIKWCETGNLLYWHELFVQFSSVTQSWLILCDSMDCRATCFPVHHQHPDFTQTHVHWVGDAIQPPHPLSCPSPPALNLSQHQGLFIWVSSSHQVAKVLEFQLQHQSFQCTFRADFL